MISVKCKNCGAELSIDTHGNLICPYCGTKNFMSDMDFTEYKNLRQNMLNYLRTENDARGDRADNNYIWSQADLLSLITIDGKTVNIRYTFCYEDDDVKTYITKDSVVNIYERNDLAKMNTTLEGIRKLSYPEAAGKDLTKSFPHIKAKFELNDGRHLLAFEKPENSYPLFAFGNLRPKHVAWIVSRMENFCCVFEYSGIVHGGLSTDTIYINPKTHEAFLYGGWWKAKYKTSFNSSTDLMEVRKISRKLLGEFINEAPQLFIDFMNSKPANDAYEDFSNWDRVIVDGFGGHNFTKFEEG